MAAPAHMPHIVETDTSVFARCSCGATSAVQVVGSIGEHLARLWAQRHAGLRENHVEVARLASKPVYAMDLPRSLY